MSEQINLQREWDKALIDGFYTADNKKMYQVLFLFKKDFGLTDEQLDSLVRLPKGFAQRNVDRRRFICAFLPKIADILWKHKASEIETLASAMSKIKYDTQKVEEDYDKISEDRKAVHNSMRAEKQAMLSKAKTKEWFDSYNKKTTWNVTK